MNIINKYSQLIIIGFFTILLSACSVTSKDYQGTQPALDLETYLNGPIEAWGMFQNRQGKVVRRFHVIMTATWQDNICTLDERFTYDDGEQQQRIWTIEKRGPHDYVGKADDVIGEAKGEAYGNALRWRYTLLLPVGDKSYQVKFDDWMFLIDENTLINKAKVKKFGFTVGEVTLFFRRQGAI